MSVRTVFLNAVTALVLVLDSPLPGIEPWDEARALARSDPGLLARRDPPTMHGCADVGRAGSVVVGSPLTFE
jgi:hypothetical protein